MSGFDGFEKPDIFERFLDLIIDLILYLINGELWLKTLEEEEVSTNISKEKPDKVNTANGWNEYECLENGELYFHI